MLRDTQAFDYWLHQEDPPYSIARPVEIWIAGLAQESWQVPSVPVPNPLYPPPPAMRTAHLPQEVDVVYQVWVGTGDPDIVDLTFVGRLV